MDIRTTIQNVFQSLEKNNFAVLGFADEPMWEAPIVGVSAGNDSYYDFIKEHIGPFHWSPSEVFALKYEDVPAADRLRVVSMIFPQTEKTRAMQQKAKVFPCDRWLVSRGKWEPLMEEFSGKLVAELEAQGYRCVSVDLQPEFSRETSPDLGIASKWSHRHAAFAAGLGTFGLSDGFISEKGKAIRITSLIIEADLEPTDRKGRGPYDWCLYAFNGSCGACIKRCPVHAIDEKGHDKAACSAYEDEACDAYWPAHIERGTYIFGCGLCQSSVPCQNRRPVPDDAETAPTKEQEE
ncbi:MAG: hypothetical protein SOR93_15890 [Clostridiales Family XIII bacterium]|nr:4Fe-4S ferredoxin [Clostridia bacterium]MDY3012719.1 hypothetical protein [Clostridiales Family XIII bacterium]